jgi:hypothetical protein
VRHLLGCREDQDPCPHGEGVAKSVAASSWVMAGWHEQDAPFQNCRARFGRMSRLN